MNLQEKKFEYYKEKPRNFVYNHKNNFIENIEKILNKKLFNLEEELSKSLGIDTESFLSNLENKEIFFSDLDNTLIKSKYKITETMVEQIKNLLERKEIVIVTGGLFETVEKNFISNLPKDTNFENLKILPLLGNEIFSYNKDLQVYEKVSEFEESIISLEDSKILKKSVFEALNEFGHPNKITDFPIELTKEDLIEDRGTGSIKTLSFAYFGQKVPKDLSDYKENWDKSPYEKRTKLIEIIKQKVPKEFLEKYSFEIGGSTTIDIARKGCDKSTGIKNYLEYFQKSKDLKKYVYLGDSFSKKGNDYPAYNMGIESIDVKNEKNTENLLNILNFRNSKILID